jgi:hypothetical protein
MAADFDPPDWVGFHDLPLSAVKPARLEQNAVGNADFSNIVEVRSPVNGQQVAALQTVDDSQRNAQEGHPFAMSRSLAIALFDRLRQGKQRRFGRIDQRLMVIAAQFLQASPTGQQ